MGSNDLFDIYIFETQQLLDRLEEILLAGEREMYLSDDEINEIFRIMHTIKGSSAMMNFDNLATVAHKVEDMFTQIREKKARNTDWEMIFDIVLNATDFFKAELLNIQTGEDVNKGEKDYLLSQIEKYLDNLAKRKEEPAKDEEIADSCAGFEEDDPENSKFYRIKVSFEPECKMENIRLFGLVNELRKISSRITSEPKNLLDESSLEEIVATGGIVYMKSATSPDAIGDMVSQTLFLQTFDITPLQEDDEEVPEVIKIIDEDDDSDDKPSRKRPSRSEGLSNDLFAKQSFISVNVNKLDVLMDMVGEIVTTEAMVTKNPDLQKVDAQLDNFEKSAQQLRKLTNELQDIVMSIRMVPVSSTFHKMQRIARDMSRKIKKDVNLKIIGEDTEVDKNINDNLSDPLMHLIRNAIDHGIEPAEERVKAGKDPVGTVTLEARNTGGDVMILVSDDGRGLNRDKLVQKAKERDLLTKPESELTDKEAFSLILAPGFSTKEQTTEFSGRGVGMDVVKKNIEKIGGTISVESELGKGMTLVIRIPLTLAIIEGMKLAVGNTVFIMPVLSIRESFKVTPEDIFHDPEGHEMIMIRGECYSVARLHEIFNIETDITNYEDGILIMVKTDNEVFCMFADKLIGEQQAVVKPMPPFIQNTFGDLRGLGGCTILGDGNISLILDINKL